MKAICVFGWRIASTLTVPGRTRSVQPQFRELDTPVSSYHSLTRQTAGRHHRTFPRNLGCLLSWPHGWACLGHIVRYTTVIETALLVLSRTHLVADKRYKFTGLADILSLQLTETSLVTRYADAETANTLIVQQSLLFNGKLRNKFSVVGYVE